MNDEDKKEMPPGFRWEKNGTYTEGALLSDYRPPQSPGTIRRCIDECNAIKIAHAIVRPAVEAATAELRAELSAAYTDLDNALAFDEQGLFDEYSRLLSENGRLLRERNLAIARAEKAEARESMLRMKVEEALALTADRERFVMMGPLAYAQVEEMLQAALTVASRGEGE